MRIIGFEFEKISAEKFKELKGKIQVKNNIQIKKIEKKKFELIKQGTPLKFSFEFKIDYTPNISELLFKGSITALLDDKKTNEVLKKWKKKKISEDIRMPLFNIILTRCNLKALQLEEELNLPLHLPLPKIPSQQSNKGYVG